MWGIMNNIPECKGCTSSTQLCEPKLNSKICPCSICIIKPICIDACSTYKVYRGYTFNIKKALHKGGKLYD